MSDKNIFDNLSDELKAKLKACGTEEELKKVLADADIELDPDMLGHVAGGHKCDSYTVPIPFQCKEFKIPNPAECENYSVIDPGNCETYSTCPTLADDCPTLLDDICLMDNICVERRTICTKMFY